MGVDLKNIRMYNLSRAILLLTVVQPSIAII